MEKRNPLIEVMYFHVFYVTEHFLRKDFLVVICLVFMEVYVIVNGKTLGRIPVPFKIYDKTKRSKYPTKLRMRPK